VMSSGSAAPLPSPAKELPLPAELWLSAPLHAIIRDYALPCETGEWYEDPYRDPEFTLYREVRWTDLNGVAWHAEDQLFDRHAYNRIESIDCGQWTVDNQCMCRGQECEMEYDPGWPCRDDGKDYSPTECPFLAQ